MKKENNINIQNDSGDKKHFTIIPNYILNHSSLYDREVYIQMKKIAGEDGKCWMSLNELIKQCDMSKPKLISSINYLIKNKWIKYVGKTKILTKGGKQFLNTYKINDIWKLNSDFYTSNKGSKPDLLPNDKVVNEMSKGSKRDDSKVVNERPTNNIYNKEDLINKIGKTPSQIMKKFLFSYQKSKEKTVQRLEELVQHSFDANELDNFVDYWTELNKTGTQQRWELEKTFELVRRFKNWLRRSFISNSSTFQRQSSRIKKYNKDTIILKD